MTKFADQARKTVLQIGERLRNEAYERAPKKRTDLARSIIVVPGGDIGVFESIGCYVGPSIDYGLWVHEGTGKFGPKKRAYPIRPKRKKALKFKPTGATDAILRRGVMHPGIRPQPFMDDAWLAIEEWALYKLADDLGEEVLSEIELQGGWEK